MMEVRFWCRLADEKIIRQRRARNYCVLLEIANSRLLKNILIDAEIPRKASAILDEDHISGIGMISGVRQPAPDKPKCLLAAVSIIVRGQSAFTATPTVRNSSAIPRTHMLMPYLEIV